MPEWIGGDRRRAPRYEKGQKFGCYSGGKRFLARAVNQGPGGAFLEVERILTPGAVLIVEPLVPDFGGRLPHLVATVAYFNFKPSMGAGVRWIKAICPTGVSDLRKFLQETIELTVPLSEVSRLPVMAEEMPVSYDFATGHLSMERKREEAPKDERVVSLLGVKIKERALDKLGIKDVRVVHSDAPKQKRAIVGEDTSLETRDSSREDPMEAARELEEWMRLKTLGRSINEDVTLAYDGRSVGGKAVSVAEKSVAVMMKMHPPDKGKRVLIQYGVPSGGDRVKVILVTEVSHVIRDRATGEWGMGGRILITNEGDNPGIFKKYLKSL